MRILIDEEEAEGAFGNKLFRRCSKHNSTMLAVAGEDLLAKTQLFEVSFDAYVGTVNGMFNAMEIASGITLYVLLSMGTVERKSARLLYGLSYAWTFTGIHMMFSSFLSRTSAFVLPLVFYYVLHQGVGGSAFIATSIYFVKDNGEVNGPALMGMLTGAFHAFHFFYVTYVNYLKK